MEQINYLNFNEKLLGGILGRGRTAIVYEYDGGALKLYHEKYNIKYINHEVSMQKLAYKKGCNVPKVIGEMLFEKQVGILFEKIQGETLSDLLSDHLDLMKDYATSFAQAHYKIHQVKLSNNIVKTDYISEIQSSRYLDHDLKRKVSKHLQTVDLSNQVLVHGDFHAENIMVSGTDMYVIDWMNSTSGNQAYDVAKTLLMIETPYGRKDVSILLKPIVKFYQKKFKRLYLSSYLEFATVPLEEINKMLIIAASLRLNENVPQEEKWLKRIITKELLKQN